MAHSSIKGNFYIPQAVSSYGFLPHVRAIGPGKQGAFVEQSAR